MQALKLHKSEKLCSLTAIDALFDAARGPHKSIMAFPLRAVKAKRTSPRRPGAAKVQFLISVPKRRLHHAVDRVKMRRRIREAYRLSRHLIPADIPEEGIDLAFIYIAPEPLPYFRVRKAMEKILQAI